MRRRTARLLVATLLMALLLTAACARGGGGGEEEKRTEPVVILSRGEQELARFTVELATTPEQQIKGLMGREELAFDQGMLFIFVPPRNVGMWMKNMLISLDFLFIDERGKVVYIAERVPPCSDEGDCPTIAAGQPVKYVLEVSSGSVARFGLAVGDQMRTLLP